MPDVTQTNGQIDINPPPRRTGNAVVDAVEANRWAHEFYEAAIIQGGLLKPSALSDQLQSQFPILYSLGTQEGTAADKLPYFTAENIFGLTDLSPFARTLLNDADAAAMLITLGVTSFTAEEVQDAVALMLVAGAGITLTYNDGANQLTIDGTVTQYTNEMAQDTIAALLQAGNGITLSYDDAANQLTISVGGIAQNIQNATYTTVLADAQKQIYHTSGSAHTWTIDSNANVAYPNGTAITFVNDGAGAVTLAITADTLVLAGTGATGSRTLAQYGVATALKVTSTRWIISGVGLS